MNTRKLLTLSVALVLLAGTVGTLWALSSDYNRPNPLMDYVPQEIAITDTRYDELDEAACRSCHGDSLADRHHYTDIVLIYRRCTDCHEVIPEPPGVLVTRDCTTSGCHSWDDVGPLDGMGTGANGWHHNTDASGAEDCTVCHDRNVVAEIEPAVILFAQYPPSVVTPTPFSCENCHWGQDVVNNGWIAGQPEPLAANAGHPSDYNHENQWGQPIGYWEYGVPILDNFDTHHMGFKGNVAAACYKCHSNDPNLPSWDPADPELIRYCEICHDISTLHTIVPHVGTGGTGNPVAVEGWLATGFHAGGGGADPTIYQNFRANDQCFGCHADLIPDPPPDPVGAPNITTMAPTAACPTSDIVIEGSGFGEEQYVGSLVQIKQGTDWISQPVKSWTDTRIVFHLQGWTFTTGNHKVRVFVDIFTLNKSNVVTLTVKDCASPQSIDPISGPCKTKITLADGSGNFGPAIDTISAPGATDGIFRSVQFTASQGTYQALNINSWGTGSVKVTVKDFYEDQDGDYFQDGNEGSILQCDGLNLGIWAVRFVYVFYGDDDGSGTYTNGDTVFQVEMSNPLDFELTNAPFINAARPGNFAKADIVKITGLNFGPTQEAGDSVRLGKRADAESPLLGQGKEMIVRMWSSTKIKIKAKPVPAAWVGKKRYVWVEKDGMKSAAKKVTILP